MRALLRTWLRTATIRMSCALAALARPYNYSCGPSFGLTRPVTCDTNPNTPLLPITTEQRKLRVVMLRICAAAFMHKHYLLPTMRLTQLCAFCMDRSATSQLYPCGRAEREASAAKKGRARTFQAGLPDLQKSAALFLLTGQNRQSMRRN